jgi:hypothetical protein
LQNDIEKTKKELSEYLKGWHSLFPMLSSITSIEDMDLLFELELNGKCRSFILDRIISRIVSLTAIKTRKKYYEAIDKKDKHRSE